MVILWLFSGASDEIPTGYTETSSFCDDEQNCRCVVEDQECKGSPCNANGQDGICLGKGKPCKKKTEKHFSLKVCQKIWQRMIIYAYDLYF